MRPISSRSPVSPGVTSITPHSGPQYSGQAFWSTERNSLLTHDGLEPVGRKQQVQGSGDGDDCLHVMMTCRSISTGLVVVGVAPLPAAHPSGLGSPCVVSNPRGPQPNLRLATRSLAQTAAVLKKPENTQQAGGHTPKKWRLGHSLQHILSLS